MTQMIDKKTMSTLSLQRSANDLKLNLEYLAAYWLYEARGGGGVLLPQTKKMQITLNWGVKIVEFILYNLYNWNWKAVNDYG